ncbi:hypothetical protein [Gemmata sp.]|uniref:hypothetical protein n=1 Tax=Gemmata sp. TaxID=1914242 RepID=UPI003F6F52C6
MLRACVLCCAVGGVAALAVGCNPNSPTSGTRATNPDSAATERDKATRKLEIELNNLDKKAADLKDRAARATGEEKAKLEAKWKELEPKRAEAAKKLGDLKAAAADKWDAAKNDVEHAFGEFKKAID